MWCFRPAAQRRVRSIPAADRSRAMLRCGMVQHRVPDSPVLNLPPAYAALGHELVRAVAPEALADARSHGPETARRNALQALEVQLRPLASQPRPALACTRGCAFCCHRQVAASAVEVFGLLAYLRDALAPEAFAAFAARCRAAAATVHAMEPAQRARSSLPCPVLVDGACSGYASRPFRCRAYNSLDLERCRDIFEHPENADAGPPADLDRYVVGQAVMFGLETGLAHAGYDPRQYELATALAEALDDASAQARYRRGAQAFLRAVVLGNG